jgi:RimJ/RimL family protein N-acetyltransferase
MGPDEPILNIVGEKVALGPLRRDLLPSYLRWINDFAVTRTTGSGLRPITREAEERWFEAFSTAADEVNFTVYERATWRAVGNCGLMHVNLQQRTAELGIMIGERDCWDRGYGTEATRLVLDYGFNVLGLHNVWLAVYSSNPRAIRVYARVGFKLVGRRRESRRLGGQVYDTLYLDCLATEFESPVLRELLAAPMLGTAARGE